MISWLYTVNNLARGFPFLFFGKEGVQLFSRDTGMGCAGEDRLDREASWRCSNGTDVGIGIGNGWVFEVWLGLFRLV